MANRRLPIMVAFRTTAERALLDASAAAEGLSVTQYVRRLVLPQVGRRCAELGLSLVREGSRQ